MSKRRTQKNMTPDNPDKADGIMITEMSHEPDSIEIQISRKTLTVADRQQYYQFSPHHSKGLKAKICNRLSGLLQCSISELWAMIASRVPILGWLPEYNFKDSLAGDIIAGSTVAILNVPQGMAYALLAGVDPVAGLYTAFFPVLIYMIFGTSRHVSMGTFAVICLMTGKIVDEYAIDVTHALPTNGILVNATNTTAGYTPLQVSAVACMVIGCWEIILGFLQLGHLSIFMSDMLISGFTTGAAIHVLTSQVKHLLGVKIPRFSGPLKIVYTYMSVIQELPNANKVAIVVSLVCILVMMFNNIVLKPIVQKRTKIPIPIELIVVIFGTLTSYLGYFKKNYGITVVGHIPTGLPEPSLLPVHLFPKIITDCLIIAVVSYSISISLANIFAKKRGYEIEPTQELYAHGISNVFGSFFSCVPMSASLSRSLVQESVGGVTQISSMVSCGLILLVMLFIGPCFESLPRCVLASIIVVALKGAFLQVQDMIAMWRYSKVDSGIWIAAFLSSVIIDVDYGLLIGILLSIVLLVVRNQNLTAKKLGKISNSDLYLDFSQYALAKEIPGFRICQFTGAIHFANKDHFKSVLKEISELDPAKMELSKTVDKEITKSKIHENGVSNKAFEHDGKDGITLSDSYLSTVSEDVERRSSISNDEQTSTPSKNTLALYMLQWIILEFSGISYVDVFASKMISQLYTSHKEVGLDLCIAGASETVVASLRSYGCFEVFPLENVYHSTHDAVCILQSKHN